MSLLCAYQWPGNVRQLENAVFRAVVLAEDDIIGCGEFPQIASQTPGCVAADAIAPVAISETVPHGLHPIKGELLDLGSATISPPAATTPMSALDLLDDNGEVRPLEHIEADAIWFAIAHYRGQMSEVARRLRIGRSTLYRKLDSLGLAGDPDMQPHAL